MNKKIIVEYDPKGRTVVTVRTVFPKKRKRNKIAGLERNYVTSEKRYIVTNELLLKISSKTVLIDTRNREGRPYISKPILKGKNVLIYVDGWVAFW